MIQLTTREGHILLVKVAADDALTIQGLCAHGVSMFDTEHDCELEESARYWSLMSEHFKGESL